MRVKVTLSNIIEYSLDVITGNSRADLLARAKEMEDSGYELFVRIPDVEGGDTEVPTERNAFEHYGPDLPEPEGVAHEQLSLSLEEQAYLLEPCSYARYDFPDGDWAWWCTKHSIESKHAVDADSHAPCLALDPHETISGGKVNMRPVKGIIED